MHQANTWSNIDQNLCDHIVLLSPNELNGFN